MKAKVGDVVHVRGVVSEVLPVDVEYTVSFNSNYECAVAVSPDEIVHVEPQPQPLKVGDVVKRNGQPFTVIRLLNNVAWMRDELGYITADLGDLERVPAEPAQRGTNWKSLFG